MGGAGPSRINGPSGDDSVQLEPAQVAVILQSAKGKKLMSRAFTLLEPPQRWALLPAIIARLLQTEPKDQTEEEKDVEAKLLKTLLQFLQHSHQFQQDQQASMPVGLGAFTMVLLDNLKVCLAGVMVAHEGKAALRGSLLSSRNRATLLHQVVTIGDKVSETARAVCLQDNAWEVLGSANKAAILDSSDEWVQSREAFMAMLDN